MFSSLRLTALKCRSRNPDGDEGDNVSEHTYEILSGTEERSKQHIRGKTKANSSAKLKKNKWRMECASLTNLHTPHQEHVEEHFEHDVDDNCFFPQSVNPVQIRAKVLRVAIHREDGSLGITLRGGYHQKPELCMPLVITQVKPGGPTDKEGVIRPGDRLLAVDGISLHETTLSEAQLLLKQQTPVTALTIEYDVSILDAVREASGPLLVEIDQPPLYTLGLTFYRNDDGIVIERVKPGSFADRCGALHVGDEILAINDTRLDNSSASVENVVKLLSTKTSTLRFEILPATSANSYPQIGTWNQKKEEYVYPCPSVSALSTLKSNKKPKSIIHQNGGSGEHIYQSAVNVSTVTFYKNQLGLTYSETLHITLSREDGSFGIEFVDSDSGDILISQIVPGGPADRCGCLQIGDRILSVNHRNIALDNLTANDLSSICSVEGQSNNINKLTLHIEFEVLESVVPASGIFIVKLVKRGTAPLGITITASKLSGFLICEMKKGSVAHRAGSLMTGDKLLAINNVELERCSLENVTQILHHSKDIVTLKVQRNESYSDTGTQRNIVYTVELQRYGGPLGITIAGSEEPFQPITVSGLTPGGLAEQTGALHLGDEIMAINNHSLYGEPLSRAHSLLQSSPDLVTLKISRLIHPTPGRQVQNKSPALPPSVDSAVESWDGRFDHTPSPEHPKHQSKDVDVSDLYTPVIHKKQKPPPSTNTAVEPPNSCLKQPQVNDKEKSPNLEIFDEITNENLKIKKELDLLADKLNNQCIEERKAQEKQNGSSEKENNCSEIVELKSPVKCPEVKHLETFKSKKETDSGDLCVNCQSAAAAETSTTSTLKESEQMAPNQWLNMEQYFRNGCNDGYVRNEFMSSQLHRVTLYKDPIYEDFGFSVSDGLYEKGVFINRIRKGGPADLSQVLKPYDRILQVNDTCTQDFDCCLTVPLIASADESLTLLVARTSAGEHDMATQVHSDQGSIGQNRILV